MFDVLKLLVDTTNQKLRDAHIALETEEKSREIATLQGRIIGWRKLLDYLREFLMVDITDTGETPPRIESLSTEAIGFLVEQKDQLELHAEWGNLLKKVAENREFLKETLITEADNARDLYLAQAQQEGLGEYSILFDALIDENYNREGELAFGDVPEELPNDE